MAKKEKLKKQKKEKQKVVEKTSEASESKRTGEPVKRTGLAGELASEKEASKESESEKIEPEKIGIEESSLEELTEKSEPQEIEEDNFSELMLHPTGEMPTPTLLPSAFSSTPETANLEERGRDAVTREQNTPTLTEGDLDYAAKVYNEPYYRGSMNEERMLEETNRRARITEPLTETRHDIEISDFNQLKMMAGGETRERMPDDYVAVDIERRGDLEERKLPFSHQRKYKELKRGR